MEATIVKRIKPGNQGGWLDMTPDKRSEVMSKRAKNRWAGVSPEARKEVARRLVEARAKKSKKKNAKR